MPVSNIVDTDPVSKPLCACQSFVHCHLAFLLMIKKYIEQNMNISTAVDVKETSFDFSVIYARHKKMQIFVILAALRPSV